MLREAEHDEEPPGGEAQVCWGRGARARQKGRGTTRMRGGEFRAFGIKGGEQSGCSERVRTTVNGRFWVREGFQWVLREANHHGTRPIAASGEGGKMGAPRG